MVHSKIQYTSWYSIDLPITRKAPDLLLYDWMMAVVCELSIPLTVVRFRRSKNVWSNGLEIRLETIQTKKEVRAIRGLSYDDQIPTLLLNAPHFRENFLDIDFHIIDSGYLNIECASAILHIPEQEIETVFQTIQKHIPCALILHDTYSIITFEYEKSIAD